MNYEKTIFRNVEDLVSDKKKRAPVFIIIYGEGVGKVFRLHPTKPSIIGRSKEVEIFINDSGISRQHASIVLSEDNKVVLQDLESTNGTFVNGKKINLHSLSDGDKIQVGSAAILKFSYQDDLEETFQQNLYQSATHDSALGIYNKKFFIDTFNKEFSFVKRNSAKLTLIMFDIDHFKKINDTHGHQAGDFVLKKLVEAVIPQLRQEDIFARYGGEEFAIILKGKPLNQGLLFAERIRSHIEKTSFEFDSKVIPVTISMGISTFASNLFPEAPKMIEDADKYLYEAKRKGRNRVECEFTKESA